MVTYFFKIIRQVISYRVMYASCHNLTMKRVSCVLHVATDKPQVTPIRFCEGLNECHDVTEKQDVSSNPPHRVDIEENTRHKQDKSNE